MPSQPLTTGLDITDICQPVCAIVDRIECSTHGWFKQRTSTLVDKWDSVTKPSLVRGTPSCFRRPQERRCTWRRTSITSAPMSRTVYWARAAGYYRNGPCPGAQSTSPRPRSTGSAATASSVRRWPSRESEFKCHKILAIPTADLIITAQPRVPIPRRQQLPLLRPAVLQGRAHPARAALLRGVDDEGCAWRAGCNFWRGSWKCVLVGEEKGGREVDAAHYLLLIRSAPSSAGPSDNLYERVGVAKLLASHLSVETSPIFIVWSFSELERICKVSLNDFLIDRSLKVSGTRPPFIGQLNCDAPI